MSRIAVVICSNIPDLASLFRGILPTKLPELVDSIHVIDYSALAAFPTVQELKINLEAFQCISFLADPSRISSILNDTDFISYLRTKSSPWLQSTWAGVESLINTKAIRENALILTRVGGIFGQQMAEYVLGQIINKERQFQKLAQNQLQRVWDKILNYRKLNQLHIAIMGAGDIGSAIAKSAKLGFNMQVSMLRRSEAETEHCDHAYTISSKENLVKFLESADYIVNVLPHTPETAGLLSGDTLRICETKKPILINVGRGSIIDEASLLKSLEEGWISAAILDVFSVEPLPQSSPLWDHPKVTVTPHVSAVSLGPDIAQLFTSNLHRHLKGQSLQFIVDPNRGY